MIKPRHALASAMALVVVASGCVAEATVPDEQESVAPPPPVTVESEPKEPERTPPDWDIVPSLSDVEACKVRDGQQPEGLLLLPEGYSSEYGVRARGNVGFPLSPTTLPIQGEANLIVAMVSFDDAPASDLTPEGFLRPQLDKMTQWSEYWSQGTFRYTFQLVDQWVNVPINHADYPVQPRVDQQGSRERAYEVSRQVMQALPDDLDYESADGVLVFWAPGIDAFEGDIGLQGNEGRPLPTPAGEKNMFFWSGNKWHYEDTGQMSAALKQEHTWSFWIYLMLDSQGLHNHGPGNGWPVGLQQSQVPSPKFSGNIIAWDAFKLGWIRDDQVDCVVPDALESDHQVVLTAQEIEGGDRRVLIVPVDESDVLVVESRRPVGYSALWDETDSGLVAYTVRPTIEVINSGVQAGCGDSPDNPKWAYFLYADGFSGDCKDFSEVFIREGQSLTHGGVTVTLEFSGPDQDYVVVSPAPN